MPSSTPVDCSRAAVPWADLPPELCCLVMDRLDAFSVLRFPAVCKSWAAAYRWDPRRLRPGALTLLTSGLAGDTGPGSFALHDVSTGRSFRAAAEGLKNRWWVGGRDDWLVTTDAKCNVELLHPASGDSVRLPSFTTIPGAVLEDKFRLIMRSRIGTRLINRFQQAALCRTPANQDGYLVVALLSPGLLAFTAAGDERWTTLKSHADGYMNYADVIAHRGAIFAASYHGDVYYWNLGGGTRDPQPQVVRAPEVPIDPRRWQQNRFSLATSGGGQLLLVCTHGDRSCAKRVKRLVYSDQGTIRARGILLHELVDIGTGVWRRVPDLSGDHVLFVGLSYPICVTVPPRGSAGDNDLKANCVYAADVAGYDAGVFDLEKGCAGDFEPLMLPNVDDRLPKPIWFRPTASAH